MSTVNKGLLGGGLGLLVLGGLTYQVDEIQEINDIYVIEEETQEVTSDIKVEYYRDNESVKFISENREVEVYGTYTSNQHITIPLSKMKYETAEELIHEILDKVDAQIGTNKYTTPGFLKLNGFPNGGNFSIWYDNDYYQDTYLINTMETTQKNITIDNFGLTEKQVAFGEEYHLLLDIDNEYAYDITKIKINSTEYDLALNYELGNIDQYVVTLVNDSVDSLVLEKVIDHNIEELYINGSWLDIDDISGSHILRTIDNVAYENQIKELDELIATKNSELADIHLEINRQQENLNIINQQIIDGQGDLDQLVIDKENIENEIIELNETREELQLDVDAYERVKEDKYSQLKQVNEELKLKQELLDEKEKELDKYNSFTRKLYDGIFGTVHSIITAPVKFFNWLLSGIGSLISTVIGYF